jgi:hypothetical protein
VRQFDSRNPKISTATITLIHAILIPSHANAVFFLFSPITPKITDSTFIIIPNGLITVAATRENAIHIAAPPGLPEVPEKIKRQTIKPMSKIAMGITARIKLIFE